MSVIRTNEVRMLDDIGKAGFTFDSLENMKQSTAVVVGQKVSTLGYYTPGDGGGNDYEIVAVGTGEDDGGSFIDLAGSGTQAKGLFFDQKPTVAQFGGVSGDVSNAVDGALKSRNAAFFNATGSFEVSGQKGSENTLLVGAGKNLVELKKRDTPGSIFEFIDSDNFQLSDVTLDNQRSLNDQGGHVISVTGGRGARISDLEIRDFGVNSSGSGGGSGILLRQGVEPVSLARISDIDFYPSAASSNVFPYVAADVKTSFFTNLYSRDVFGTTGYAHELKNKAEYNILSHLITENAAAGVVYGQESAGIDGSDYNLAHAVVNKQTNTGYLVGEGFYNVLSGMMHDSNGSPGGLPSTAVWYSGGASRNASFGVVTTGGGAGDTSSIFDGDDNYLQIACHDSSSSVVEFREGSERNLVEVVGTGGRLSIRGLINDLTGSLGAASSNVVHSPLTGERIGSASRYFHDKLGDSGASIPDSVPWRYETAGNNIHGYATAGGANTISGFTMYAPSGQVGRLWHVQGATPEENEWQLRSGNSNYALRVGDKKVRVTEVLNLTPIPSAPANPEEGDVYFDSGLKKARCYDGTSWNNLF